MVRSSLLPIGRRAKGPTFRYVGYQVVAVSKQVLTLGAGNLHYSEVAEFDAVAPVAHMIG